MKYSTKVSDAVHILSFIALNAKESLTSQAIAESVKTNPAFVRQMMSSLRNAGLLTSVKGHAKPALSRDAKDISLLDVYRAVEGDKPLLHQDTHTNPECGKGFILDTLCGKTYAISPRSFYQINHTQTEVLYGLAVDAAHLTGKEVVLDAYCGIGTIGLTAADHAKQVVGVEVNREAVHDAIGNAKHNGVKNARFFAADATRWIGEAAAAGERADVIFMDPPREGSTPQFIDSVARMAPKRVVYVSCNPATLARDLELLTRKGYKVESSTPVDMFPHSEHIETVCALSKLNAKQHIEVEIKTDELDLTAAESKATYEEIREYVKEHTGLNVSDLYIAQVKRKCGIKERQNYNKPKAENPKQLKCPPEKEKAIREALKYFKMI